MSVTIDIRVSPSLDPETVKAVEGYNDDTAPFVGDVVSAFNDIYVTLGKVHTARDLADSNPAWTPENRILMVGKEAAVQKERVSRRLDRAHDDLKARILHTETALSRPLTEQATLGNLNIEVRAHAKSLTRSDRTKLLNESLAADDEVTLSAILGAQHFLSGLSREDHAHYVRLYHSKKNPHLVARLGVMRSVLDLIHTNGIQLHRQFEKAIGARPIDVRAIENANSRALNALKIEPAA